MQSINVVTGLKRFFFFGLAVLVSAAILSQCGKANSKLVKGFSDPQQPLEIVRGNVKWTFTADSPLDSAFIFLGRVPRMAYMSFTADAFFVTTPTIYAQFQELKQKQMCASDLMNNEFQLCLILTDNPAVLHKIRQLKEGQAIKLLGYHLSETHRIIHPQKINFTMELPQKNVHLIFLQDVTVQSS